MSMRIEEFDYFLPKELVAQHPEKERAASRLLVLDRKEGVVTHSRFSRITDYLHEGDVLVLNDSRVFPARLTAVKETGGRLDVLLVERKAGNRWACLTKGIKRGTNQLNVTVGNFQAELARDGNGGGWELEFFYDGDSFDIVSECGTMPLPGYIKRKEGHEPGDFERYQTVYADPVGSIAAPTAGFHFTRELLEGLEKNGVCVVKITLHVGIGTFLLIKAEEVERTLHARRALLRFAGGPCRPVSGEKRGQTGSCVRHECGKGPWKRSFPGTGRLLLSTDIRTYLSIRVTVSGWWTP